MKYCENCGSRLEDDALFCEECGTKQESQTSSATIKTSGNINGNADMDIAIPDENTLDIKIKGIPLSLKLVEGKDYGDKKEILDFYIGETPVTQALWSVLLDSNPSNDISNLFSPVTNINPTLITSFLIKLNKITGVKFELPTERQWEFAYQGGTKSMGYKYSGSNNLEEVGWSDNQLHPVGELYANELGIMDMEGNIEELLKEGKWALISKNSKKKLPDDNLAGFRLVLNIPLDEKIKEDTFLQKIISKKQGQLLSQRDKIIAELEKKKEEEARLKAEEEARKKAEEEEAKRIKAEEEARKKAEEEARKKAQLEAKRLKAEEEARLKAEKEAKEKFEREARIKSLEAELIELRKNADILKKELEESESLLKENKKNIAVSDSKIKELKNKANTVRNSLEELEKRFQVILKRRVEYSLFSSKGKKFDEALSAITGANVDMIKKWNSQLKNGNPVVISGGLDRATAMSWQAGIINAGGDATVESFLPEQQYQLQLEKLTEEKNNIDLLINDAIKVNNEEKEASKKAKINFDNLSTQFKDNNLKIVQAELEMDYLKSKKSIKEYIIEKVKISENIEPLSKLFPDEYGQWEADNYINKNKDKNGFVKYPKKEEAKFQKLFTQIVGSQYEEYKKTASAIEESVLKKVSQINTGKWKSFGEYGKDHMKYGEPSGNYKGKIKYAFIDKDTLVLKGEGEMPDFLCNPFASINMEGNYWQLNDDIKKKQNNIRNIIVIGEIKSIGKANFKDFDKLKIVVLPKSIQNIKDEGVFSAAFCDLESLPNLKEIGLKAFRDLDQRYFFVPSNVKKMNDMAFGWSNENTIIVCKDTKIEEASDFDKILSAL